MKYNSSKILSCDAQLRASFDQLPVDDFMHSTDSYRYRRYQAAKLINNELRWSETVQAFSQSKLINGYAGDAKRVFALIEDPTKKAYQDAVLPDILKQIRSGKTYDLGVHQIRITTSDEIVGRPAPEGIHQDGFDFIHIACITARNVVGGTSILFEADDKNEECFSATLGECETLFFNDRILAHYASPIVPRLPGQGYRDVFVTSLQEC